MWKKESEQHGFFQISSMLWPSLRKHLLAAASLSQILQCQSTSGLSDLDLCSWTPPVLTTPLRLLSKSLIVSLPHPSCHHRRSQRATDHAEKMRCDVCCCFPRCRASCQDVVAWSNHLRSSDYFLLHVLQMTDRPGPHIGCISMKHVVWSCPSAIKVKATHTRGLLPLKCAIVRCT